MLTLFVVTPHWPEEPLAPGPFRSAAPLALPHDPSRLLASFTTSSHQSRPEPSLASGTEVQVYGDVAPTLHSLPVTPKLPPSAAGSCDADP